jgi:HEAT repeat protein
MLKIPFLGRNDDFPFAVTGKPDRISQTLFGKYGEEKRWEALDAISAPGQTSWHQRLMLWMLSSENIEMRDRCWEMLDQQSVNFEMLVNELSCPMWQVRVGVIRLIAKSGRLDIVRLLIAGIEDYHQNVIDETKRSLIRLVENAKIRKSKNQLPKDEVHDALNALYQPLYTAKRSPRFQALQFLFMVAPLDEDLFWEMYLNLDLPQYTTLHDEFIRYQKEGSLVVLYRGLLQQDEHILERLTSFIAVAVRNSGENVNHHLNSIRSLSKEEFVKLAFVLQHYRILVEFQGLIKHMNPSERIVLFDLLEAVGAEQNLSFLLRCLQLDDSRIRIRVLKILGESEQLGLRHEVFEFLTDTDEQVLLATLRYLQKKGDLSILEKISHLTRSKKKKVRQGVISTMFKIMKDMLLSKFDTFTYAKRSKMLQWLLKMKPTFFKDIHYLSESPEESDRIKYIKMLDAESLSKALEDYRRMSRDPNPKVRATAVKGFERIKDEETRFKIVYPFYQDTDGRVRANSIELLPDVEPVNKDMVAIAKRATKSDIRREKANALAKVLNWGYKEYEPALNEMLDSDEEWTKTSALWVLGVTDLPHQINRLREAANDKRSHVREMAVRGIGIKGTEEDLRALMPYLQDPDRNVRLAAQKALRARLHLSFEIA